MNNKEWRSIRVEDALDSMKQALTQSDPSRCAGCFDKLNKALEAIDRNPEDEAYHLSKWSMAVRTTRMANNCGHCRPPVWRQDLTPSKMSRIAPNMNEFELFEEDIFWD